MQIIQPGVIGVFITYEPKVLFIYDIIENYEDNIPLYVINDKSYAISQSEGVFVPFIDEDSFEEMDSWIDFIERLQKDSYMWIKPEYMRTFQRRALTIAESIFFVLYTEHFKKHSNQLLVQQILNN